MTTLQSSVKTGGGLGTILASVGLDITAAEDILHGLRGWEEKDLIQLIGDESATIMAMVGTALTSFYQRNEHGITTGNNYADIAGVSLLALGSGIAAELLTSWYGDVKFDTSAQNILSFGLQSVGVALLIDGLYPHDYSYEAISVDGAV